MTLTNGAIFMLNEGSAPASALFARADGSLLATDTLIDLCEHAAILPDGSICIQAANGAFSTTTKFYALDFSLRVAVTRPQHLTSNPVASNGKDKFYTIEYGGGQLSNLLLQWDSAGTLLKTWTLTKPVSNSPIGLAVDSADTIAYYVQLVSSTWTVKRWDLVNNVALTDLISLPSNFLVTGMHEVVMTTAGDLLFGVARGSSIIDPARTLEWRRYGVDGTLKQTYSVSDAKFDDGGEPALLAIDYFDTSRFWYRIDPDPTGDTCVFRSVDLASGATQTSWTVNMDGTTYFVLGYAPASCPFLVLVGQSAGLPNGCTSGLPLSPVTGSPGCIPGIG